MSHKTAFSLHISSFHLLQGGGGQKSGGAHGGGRLVGELGSSQEALSSGWGSTGRKGLFMGFQKDFSWILSL